TWSRTWPEPPRPSLEGNRAVPLEVDHPAHRDALVAAFARQPQLPASGDQGVYDVVAETDLRSDEAHDRPPDDEGDEDLHPGHRAEQTLEAQHHSHSHWTDFADPAPAPIPDGPLSAAAGPGVWLYPEWDAVAGRLREDWCLLRERVPDEPASTAAHDLTIRRYGTVVPRLRRHFERVAPRAWRTVRRVADGDDVDVDAAVEALVDVRAGAIASDDVYQRHERARREVAVAFLLDLSSSTAEHLKSAPFTVPEPGMRRIIDVERMAAALLVESLRATGDPFGLYGFSSSGRDQVDVIVVKALDEPLTQSVLHRIDGLRPLRGTRMGAPIRHLTRTLARTASATKLLVIVSDGRPHDLGYGHTYAHGGQDLAYALGDTRHALEHARASGVHPYLLTVDASGDEYLGEACGDLPYEVLSDVISLPERLLSLYHEMAAAPGRMSDRSSR
ncbi:MAG: nitric oxide reductase activation protein NorD, partial [Egibacteraceae bacterium]